MGRFNRFQLGVMRRSDFVPVALGVYESKNKQIKIEFFGVGAFSPLGKKGWYTWIAGELVPKVHVTLKDAIDGLEEEK